MGNTSGRFVTQRNLLGITLGIILSSVFAGEAGEIEAFNSAYLAYLEYEEFNDYQRAVPEAKAAYTLSLQLYGKAHPKTAALAHGYGLMLLKVDDLVEAKKVLREAVKINGKFYGKDGVEIIPVLIDLGAATADTARPDKQRHVYNRALKIANKHYGSNSAKYGEIVLDVGIGAKKTPPSVSAMRYLGKAYQILKNTLGENDPATGFAAIHLAEIEILRKLYDEAEAHLLASLNASKDPDRPSSELEIKTHALLVSFYEEIGESDKATVHCQAIGRMTPVTKNQKYFPIHRIEPTYPRVAQRNGVEGYVDVRYTVDEEGYAQDVEVITTKGVPANTTLEAIKKWRFAPRFVDGQPVITPNVTTRLTFKFSTPSSDSIGTGFRIPEL